MRAFFEARGAKAAFFLFRLLTSPLFSSLAFRQRSAHAEAYLLQTYYHEFQTDLVQCKPAPNENPKMSTNVSGKTSPKKAGIKQFKTATAGPKAQRETVPRAPVDALTLVA